MASEKSLDRLEKLEDAAIDVLESGLRDNNLDYGFRLKAAQDVLDRRRVRMDAPISKDEAVERLTGVIGGLAQALFGDRMGGAFVGEVLRTVEAECEEEQKGSEYRGKVNVRAISEKEKYKE